jgi:hypothetical protein
MRGNHPDPAPFAGMFMNRAYAPISARLRTVTIETEAEDKKERDAAR